MKWIFWVSATLILYTYAGYPAWLWLRWRWRERPVKLGEDLKTVSVVMVCRNEEGVLADKLENLKALDYPRELVQIVAVSDGSTDGTSAVLQEYEKRGELKAVILPTHEGKSPGLNAGLQVAAGEIILFTDARQKLEGNALRFLMENFSDASVGAASGELMLGDPESGESSRGVGLYWRMEKNIRGLESASGSVVGATGALYCVRKSLVPQVPADAILDDVYTPMMVVRQGYRVVFDPRARAWDRPVLAGQHEFRRKVRTLTGNYQLLRLAPWLLGRSNSLRFEFVSHKLLRLIVPVALLATLVTSMLLPGPVYRTVFLFQIAFYALGILAVLSDRLGFLGRLADTSLTFVLLNTAALVALLNFITGRRPAWMR
jgi:cellulose synthase/poly-beta-1,6-N-acetylglucosamine synthase-like glycosyltransferase